MNSQSTRPVTTIHSPVIRDWRCCSRSSWSLSSLRPALLGRRGAVMRAASARPAAIVVGRDRDRSRPSSPPRAFEKAIASETPCARCSTIGILRRAVAWRRRRRGRRWRIPEITYEGRWRKGARVRIAAARSRSPHQPSRAGSGLRRRAPPARWMSVAKSKMSDRALKEAQFSRGQAPEALNRTRSTQPGGFGRRAGQDLGGSGFS